MLSNVFAFLDYKLLEFNEINNNINGLKFKYSKKF